MTANSSRKLTWFDGFTEAKCKFEQLGQNVCRLSKWAEKERQQCNSAEYADYWQGFDEFIESEE